MYLAAHHLPATATVGNKLPNPRLPVCAGAASRWHANSGHRRRTDRARVLGQALQSARPAATLRSLLLCLPGKSLRHTVYWLEMGGPYNLPDPTSTSPRWVMELQVHIRGLAAS